jgi:hypothetical protein
MYCQEEQHMYRQQHRAKSTWLDQTPHYTTDARIKLCDCRTANVMHYATESPIYGSISANLALYTVCEQHSTAVTA